ncbi:MAG: hypothetical protein IT531_06900 [Burkholderiales bacterium]|nr:hypothetical protein [Burkholderiales bacterium]
MAKGKAVIFVGFKEVPGDIEPNWNRWYDASHIPARLALPGFLAARRFRAYEGECGYVTLYDLEDARAVQHPDYAALKRRELALSPESFEARTLALPGFMRAVYNQVFPATAYQAPATKFLFVVAHDLPPHKEDEFAAWYDTEHIPAMLKVPGFVTARRFKRDDASGATANAPRYMTIYDLGDKNAVECEQFVRDRESPWSAWVRSWYTRRLRIKAERI